jgi:3-methyladenine DNA glycosylase AlkD
MSKLNLENVLLQLEQMGKEQTRRTYRRHGVSGPQFGVSYADLEVLRKQVKLNQPLAQQLWSTGNHDARVLATKIADPQQVDEALISSWSADLANYVLTDAFVDLVAKGPHAIELAGRWTQVHDQEWIGRAGWGLLAGLALYDTSLPDEFFIPYLDQISCSIHQQLNRIRQGMNTALLAIGTRSDELEEHALLCASAIGPVNVDHGDTSCKTPDALTYIPKARAHQRSKRARTR